MPTFQARLLLPRSVDEIFDFFTRPANHILVAPPEIHLKLVEGPERLTKGAAFTCKSKQMGVAQQVVMEVLDFQQGKSLTIQQRRGPLKKWVHTMQFAEKDKGTELHDRVEFEPPGGILGLLVTAEFLESTIQSTFGFREKKLRELFS